MTRTEERLSDALNAAASKVDDARLRPLPGAEPVRDNPRWRGAWRSWLAPVAAAASVALVAGVAVAVHSGGRPDISAGPSTSTSAGVTTNPAYYAIRGSEQRNGSAGVKVYALRTGKLVGTVLPPALAAGLYTWPVAIAAGPDDRTFYAEYYTESAQNGSVSRTSIYRFTLASSGALSPMKLVNGGVLQGVADPLAPDAALAVSPDGGELAFTFQNQIIILKTATGSRTTWQGGLVSQLFVRIVSLSWSADGRSLVFTAQWCENAAHTYECSASDPVEVRALNAAGGGGSLASGHVLLKSSERIPGIAAADAGPSGSDLVVVQSRTQLVKHVRWAYLTILDVSSDNGAILRRFGQQSMPLANVKDAVTVLLAAAPGNEYFFLNYTDDDNGSDQLALLTGGGASFADLSP